MDKVRWKGEENQPLVEHRNCQNNGENEMRGFRNEEQWFWREENAED